MAEAAGPGGTETSAYRSVGETHYCKALSQMADEPACLAPCHVPMSSTWYLIHTRQIKRKFSVFSCIICLLLAPSGFCLPWILKSLHVPESWMSVLIYSQQAGFSLTTAFISAHSCSFNMKLSVWHGAAAQKTLLQTSQLYLVLYDILKPPFITIL